MIKKIMILCFISLFLLGISGCGDTSMEETNKEASTDSDAPSAEEQAIWSDVTERIYSSENPGLAPTPSSLDGSQGQIDYDALERWQNEQNEKENIFQKKVMEETGKKYNISPEEVDKIDFKVSSWRVDQGLPLQP